MASDNNLSTHNETYGGFLVFLKWGTIAVALFAVFAVIGLLALPFEAYLWRYVQCAAVLAAGFVLSRRS